MKSEAIVLKSRPEGTPTSSNFELTSIDVADPAKGELLVEVTAFSVDPYMRGRMSDRDSYIPPFPLGEPLDGGMVGRVLKSESPKIPEGAMVVSDMSGGWRRHAIVQARDARLIDTESFSPTDYLGAAGMPGITAYGGLFEVGRPRAGDTVLVSAASGAVGSLVAQFARINGCRVIGAAGSKEKVQWLQEKAKIEAFNYRETEDLPSTLKELAPEGIDLYWDNVGGPFLEAALGCMNLRGTVAMCGQISGYNDTEAAPGPKNLMAVIGKRLRLEGLMSMDLWHLESELLKRLALWKKNGDVVLEETVIHGLEKAPDAFLGLFSGDNLGKMIVSLE